MKVLNQIETPSFPSYELRLRVGSIIMLLKNLHLQNGLMVVRRLQAHVIHAEIISGQFNGRHVFIPRIPMTLPASEVGVRFKRRQFPIKLAFAMTINRVQGRTFDRVGLLLKCPVVDRGQLNMALSRVRSLDSLSVKFPEGRTTTTVDGQGRGQHAV